MAGSKKKAGEKPTFKERLDSLSDLVQELEQGELDLEDAIERFEKGKKLHRELLGELDAYDERLQKLVRRPDGEDGLEDAEPPGSGGTEPGD